ncbi:MAG: hypothetical protein ACLQPD_00945 [Desulfomonilaceae bacterium]
MEDIPRIPDEVAQKRWPDGFKLRDEANVIVAYALRNGPIEDLHAGKPSKLFEDESFSRITDEEMKRLMIYASRRIEMLLRLKKNSPAEYSNLANGHNWISSFHSPQRHLSYKSILCQRNQFRVKLGSGVSFSPGLCHT